jgi:hypothetical protein
MEARNKLHAEAGLEEQKTVLGWLIDTRHLLVRLPKNKFIAWSNIIGEMMQKGTTHAKEIEKHHRAPGTSRNGHSTCVPFLEHDQRFASGREDEQSE